MAEHDGRGMRRALTALLATTALALTPAAATAAQPLQHFGRLFDNLPAFTAPSTQELVDLSLADQDPNTPPENLAEPSGFTYLGQFLDHDLTLDTLPQPTTPVDPTTLVNNRTFALDLDSVFGDGPNKNPELFAADHRHMLLQDPNPNGVRDLPRRADGSAILVEGRNDENQLVSQVHVAFIAFYNRLIDQGYTYKKARRLETQYWQWIVLHDLLPHLIGQDRIDQYFKKNGKVDTPLFKHNQYTPVEFAVAAYRLHTIVRLAYVINDNGPGGINKVQVFNAAGNDLHGGRQLGADRQLEFGNFLPELNEQPSVVNGQPAPDANFGRPFDTKISRSLYALPIPGAEPEGSNNLAARNLIRGHFYDLPSGQAVARRLGNPVIPASQINPTNDPVFNQATPLWQYLNAESEREVDPATGVHGYREGPTGSAIIAQTILRVIADDPKSILNKPFEPQPPIAPSQGNFDFADFLVFAGVADRP